jgi:hypothetical protein
MESLAREIYRGRVRLAIVEPIADRQIGAVRSESRMFVRTAVDPKRSVAHP